MDECDPRWAKVRVELRLRVRPDRDRSAGCSGTACPSAATMGCAKDAVPESTGCRYLYRPRLRVSAGVGRVGRSAGTTFIGRANSPVARLTSGTTFRVLVIPRLKYRGASQQAKRKNETVVPSFAETSVCSRVVSCENDLVSSRTALVQSFAQESSRGQSEDRADQAIGSFVPDKRSPNKPSCVPLCVSASTSVPYVVENFEKRVMNLG
jgi:hypothetical protein